MPQFIATMGTSPGAVYETLLNLCRGRYDAGEETPMPVTVKLVRIIHTRDPRVEAAAKAARLLIHCSAVIYPEGDERRLPCSVPSAGLIPLSGEDVKTRRGYEELMEKVRELAGEERETHLDVTGGRVAMAVAAALAAREAGASVYTSSIPQEKYRELNAAFQALTANYDLDAVWAAVQAEGCQALARYQGIRELLAKLVTGRASTVRLHP